MPHEALDKAQEKDGKEANRIDAVTYQAFVSMLTSLYGQFFWIPGVKFFWIFLILGVVAQITCLWIIMDGVAVTSCKPRVHDEARGCWLLTGYKWLKDKPVGKSILSPNLVTVANFLLKQ